MKKKLLKFLQPITDWFVILHCYWITRKGIARIECQHIHSTRNMIEYYPEGEWTCGNDDFSEFATCTVKLKCQTCGVIFLEKSRWVFRNRYTKEFLH